ncbi:type VII secretion protein EssC [Mesobacillus foraminis]|uniref:S-DNA-T family DNA segregation ATPase FtsK/SpoIIIE n=1 Tax=Mesobacillus foraminis TaxID=279826 RepID=A0A4V2RDA9_9BACI|nr:type VII secretion protein EssC [Mesobacillus foraminis]TCN24100.1 S-DNA-T family DNA segregation ATPase FtsK/SpoIIIE [Mesobacillus foraminis]
MILTLFDQDKAFNLVLPDRVTGRYVLSTEDQDNNPLEMMAVEAENEQWHLKSNKTAFLKNDQNERVSRVRLEPFKTYTIHRDGHSHALLYVEPPTSGRNEYTKHTAVSNSIKIGRSKESQICFSNKLVSSSHCVIEYTPNGGAVIRDQNSSNGTYVNGDRIKEKKLNVGDVIFIMGLKIVFNGRLLSLNNPHGSVFLDRNSLHPYIAEKPVIQEEEELDDFHVEEEAEGLFYRSPRFKRDINTAVIKIDPPPQQPSLEETPLMLMLGPSITMGMASMFTGLITLQNVMNKDGDIMMAMPTLVMSISMLIGTVLWPILTKQYEKKKKIKLEGIRQEKYLHYLEEMKQVIKDECTYQSEILHENHVGLDNCLSRIKRRQRNLWERGLGQDDFLKVRLGLGDLPLNADVKYPEKRFMLEDDNLQDELYKIVETPQILKNVPVTLSLVEDRISGIIGNREEVKSFVKGLIFQLTALHSYDELKLVFIYDDREQEDWKFVKWLPHVWSEDRDVRFIATDSNEVKELSVYFEKEINARAELTEDELNEIPQHTVVFSMSKSLGAKAEMISLLLKEKKNLGFSLITLYDELKNLPKECSNVIELGGEYSKIFDKDDISGKYTGFNADIYMQEDPEELAVALANIQLATSGQAYVLPEMLTFLEMFGVGKIEHLNALTRWKENNPTVTIETPIGVDGSGEPFKIDLHEKYHGPHGLIAGMTGSGKSEFIMTFILSLAVNYHPDEVAFILIDYKGGGMANAFTDLPHLAGTITNLDGAAVNRSLISIQSELKRRQAIFSETGRRLDQSNIDIYKYQKLYREGLVTEPLQHLFIISDEFAELKSQQPEFMEQLVSAARIGRSLGVHLILATQKPSGVVDDQIWSNSKFRISLKVQEKADSMEVIKRPDAAELSTTGRFYLQVGFNELFELGQSAWAGAPYYPSNKVEKSKDESVVVIDELGRVMKTAKIDRRKHTEKNPPKQIDEVTDYLASLARQENISVRQLWLEPIPAFIFLDELREKYQEDCQDRSNFVLNPVIGEYDDPANQRQMVMRMPITRDGNAVIYGVAGGGKTTLLSTMIYSLMSEHTPDEVNFYLLDFSSETMTWFREAPHVGDVILSHESEKIANLFKMLGGEIERRKKLLAIYGGDFGRYNEMSAESLPAIVVSIHNYSAFSEMYEVQEEAISFLTREGVKYGIYFVLTASNTGAIRYRLLQNFKQLYVLQLNDRTEYSGILGSIDGVYPSKFKGRGIFKTDQTYEFQSALITRKAENMYQFITDYCRNARESWNRPGAKRVPILPEKVNVASFGDELTDRKGRIAVGIEKNSLRVSMFDYKESFIHIASGNSAETVTPFMQGAAELFGELGNGSVIVLDPNQHFTWDESRRYEYHSNAVDLEQQVVELFHTLVHRNNTTKDRIAEGLKPPVFDKIVCLIDSFSDLMMMLSPDAQDKLKVFLEKGSGLNVHMIISDSGDKISSFSFDSWFKQHVSLNDFIWAGSGITDQYVLKTSKVTTEMYQEIPNDFGYVVVKGKATLVKLLRAAATREEEAVYHG